MNWKPARSDCCLLAGLRSATEPNDLHFGKQFSLMCLSAVDYLLGDIAQYGLRRIILTWMGAGEIPRNEWQRQQTRSTFRT